MSALVFVRHGETDANRDGVLLGRLDPSLNAVGRDQAAAVGDRLAQTGAARIVTSPLARAVETAETVARALGIDVFVDDRLIEIEYGEYDGMALRSLPSDLVEKWRSDESFAPPGGESLAEVGVRMGEFTREYLDALAAGSIVAVSHVSPIKAAVLWALEMPQIYAWRLRLDNASVTRLAPGPAGPVLHTFNER